MITKWPVTAWSIARSVVFAFDAFALGLRVLHRRIEPRIHAIIDKLRHERFAHDRIVDQAGIDINLGRLRPLQGVVGALLRRLLPERLPLEIGALRQFDPIRREQRAIEDFKLRRQFGVLLGAQRVVIVPQVGFAGRLQPGGRLTKQPRHGDVRRAAQNP